MDLTTVTNALNTTVNVSEVIGALIALAAVWFVGRKVFALGMSAVHLLRFVWSTATVMLGATGMLALTGFTALGYGVAELRSDPAITTPNISPLSNEEVLKIVTSKDATFHSDLKDVLAFIENRDNKLRERMTYTSAQATEQPTVSNTKIGWTAFVSGIGAILIALISFLRVVATDHRYS